MTEPDTIQKKLYEKRRWLVYTSALALVVIITSAEVTFYYREGVVPLLETLSSMVVIVGVLAWCIYDSKARGFHLSSGSRWAIALLGVVFVPTYFWHSRGVKKSVKSLFGLALYLPFCAAYYGAWYLVAEILSRLGYYSP